MMAVVIIVQFFKKTAAIVLSLAVLLGTSVLSLGVSAASAGDDIKGNTVCQALKMDGAAYMNWLLSHEHDSYYLGTPYAPWDHRNPNGDCKGAYGYFDEYGVPGMNCMGFIWHVMYKATGFSDGNMDELWRIMSRMGFYRGLNLTRRYFANKQQMLDSGYLEKGDLIWMILDQDEDADCPYDHIGIYWGDGHSDLLWHSNRVTGGQGECNAISKIYPEVDRNTMYIVLKVGAKTLSVPKLTSAVNTDSGISITWSKVDRAYKYRVFKKTATGWQALGDTAAASFTYTDAAEGEDLLFTVRCITACGKGYTSMFDSKGIRCQRHSPSAVYAPAIETSGDYEYSVMKDGSAQIVRYKGTAAVLSIPSEIGGHSVSGIGAVDTAYDSAPFANCKQLTSVTIPDGVTTVGAYAFVNCTALKQVTIPDSVRIIGNAAFGWTVAKDSTVPSDGFVLYGSAGSAAQRYVNKSENAFITFALLGSVIPDLSAGGKVFGDADADGAVTILDATCIQRLIAELPTTAYNMRAADVDTDGAVTILDATSIQRYIAELPTHERIGKAIQ